MSLSRYSYPRSPVLRRKILHCMIPIMSAVDLKSVLFSRHSVSDIAFNRLPAFGCKIENYEFLYICQAFVHIEIPAALHYRQKITKKFCLLINRHDYLNKSCLHIVSVKKFKLIASVSNKDHQSIRAKWLKPG